MCLRLLFTGFFMWTASMAFCQSNSGGSGHKMGRVTSPALDEVSGIVASERYIGCFWVHNDSGDEAAIYLIDSTASLLHTVRLEGVEAIDFEEIAWFYDKLGNYNLVIGDIGDNLAVRNNIAFHVVEEPQVDLERSESIIPYSQIKSYRAVYPSGARDAEAFFVDPLSGELVLISKRDFHVHVYTSKLLNGDPSATHTLSKKTQLPIHFVTAADVSRDGHYILVKNLVEVYLWSRNKCESIVEAFNRSYRTLPYEVEPQGEAITFGSQSNTFYTISEKPLFLDSYLYRHKF